MSLKIQILQQKSSVELLRALVKTKRATHEELEAAERRLAELEGLTTEAEKVEPPKTVFPEKIRGGYEKPIPENVPQVQVLSKKILDEIDELKRKLGDVCNSMHLVPKEQPCPELMQEAMELKDKEEELWTKYRYLERNGKLPDEPEAKTMTETNAVELLEAMSKRNALAQKRSKLKAKLADVTNLKNKNREKWQVDFDYADMTIRELDLKILKLKG